MVFNENKKQLNQIFLKTIQKFYKNVIKVDNLNVHEHYFNVHFNNGVIICVNECFNGDTWILSQIEYKLKQSLETE